MNSIARQPSRYHCVVCGQRVKTARETYVREDRPYGARLCHSHAQIVSAHFTDSFITTLELAIIRNRLRQAGHEVGAPGSAQTRAPIEIGYSAEKSQEILSKLLSR